MARIVGNERLGARCLVPSSGAMAAALVLAMNVTVSGQQPLPEDVGDFLGPYSWRCQICPELCDCEGVPVGHPCGSPEGNTLEWSHAALIPHGTYQGHVLMWGHTRGNFEEGTNQAETWLFNPNGSPPNKVLFVGSSLVGTSIFCGAMTWDVSGDLVVAGGQTSMAAPTCPESEPPNRAYKFRPGALQSIIYPYCGNPPLPPCSNGGCESPLVTGNAWTPLGDMSKPRYYPSLITLVRAPITSEAPLPNIAGSSSFVVGGAPRQCHWTCEDNNPPSCCQVEPIYPPVPPPPGCETFNIDGTAHWQMLEPGASDWSHTYYTTADPTPETEGLPLSFEDPPDGEKEEYVLRPVAEPPEPTIDSYPRMYQLMNTQSSRFNIFIANDIDSFDRFDSSPGNLPGASWIIKLRYPGSLLQQAELWKADSSVDGESKDRNYNASVLIHDLGLAGGTSNRVLIFGGEQSDGNEGSEVNPTVQEFAAGTDPAAGEWKLKSPLQTPRLYGNAVILPTREILIIGGLGMSFATSHLPELYDPGNDANEMGSSTMMASAPPSDPMDPMSPPYPRPYHNFALLLPDASVLNAGGEEIIGLPDGRFTGEIFRPPYLHYGFRPAITGTRSDNWEFWDPDQDPTYDPTTWIAVGVQHTKCIDKFVLLRPAAITHQYDADQRYIELDWRYLDESQDCIGNETQITFWVRPPTEDQGPLGYYMLFVIEKDDTTGRRVPSVARFIRMVE